MSIFYSVKRRKNRANLEKTIHFGRIKAEIQCKSGGGWCGHDGIISESQPESATRYSPTRASDPTSESGNPTGGSHPYSPSSCNLHWLPVIPAGIRQFPPGNPTLKIPHGHLGIPSGSQKSHLGIRETDWGIPPGIPNKYSRIRNFIYC